jgi:hypothetical protein
MKWFRALILIAVVLLFASDVMASNVTRIASGTSEVGVAFKHMVQGFAIMPDDEDVSVVTYVNGTQVDSFYVESGRSMFLYSPCDSVYIIRGDATAVTVNPTYNNQINPSLGSNPAPKMVGADWITITDGYHTAAASHYTFLPLQPLGDHNLVSFQISCTTWPDTLWYQVVASNSMMDSLTVFNFGTTAAPQYVNYITSTSLATSITTTCEYLDNSSTEKWTPTGVFAVALPFSFMVQDASGYPGLPKFVGIRIGSDSDTGIVGLKIVMGLATLNTCGGE